MKIIFLGTPEFSVSVLADLLNSKHEIIAVVTQPDKPFGRSGKLQASPVKVFAQKHNLKVLQFERIKRLSAIEELKTLNADIMITAAYGQMLSQAVLDITPLGVFNVHGSLLPKYRGAAPIQWAIINGETITGITIMKTNIGMDTGDMLLKEKIRMEKDDTSGDLFKKMSKIAGTVLLKALQKIENKTAVFKKQDEKKATHFPMLKKEDGLINFSLSASQIVNLVRGTNPWPCAYTYLQGQKLIVLKATAGAISLNNLLNNQENVKNGQVLIANVKDGLFVKTGSGAVRLNIIKPEGKKEMSDIAFLNGKKIEEGCILGEE